ncbi:CCA tRNA nucleotidyltransferase [Candidatus Woesearchaeota archaeon]|nr:CCA tRNA nucleotidyltransferase [Candidatus Woesearchaeota archaeon]|tara:strand:- start:832 stop:2085 length:1254 start_codon:yes stop_codon:yes gene_type:complete
MDKLLTEILKTLKPSKEEESAFISVTNNVLKRLNSSLKDAKAILGGSGAKDTWLKGSHDVDIFVLFNYNKFKENHLSTSDILEKALKKKFKAIKRIPGSRDYFQLKEKGYVFEIVPILNIKKAEESLNITDISPLHVDWVKKHKKLCDEIRLTKSFCKAQRVYGAESYIKGFSGYLLEILAIHYKSFHQLLKSAAKWKEHDVIDTEKYYKNSKEALNSLNKSKLISPLIVIDPVQKERNVAAALDGEKFIQFKEAARKFLKKPDESFFIKKELDTKKLKQKAGKDRFILLEAESSGSKEDIIGCKLLKVFNYICRQLTGNDFKIINNGWDFDRKSKAILWYIIDKKKLSDSKKVIGPPVKSKYHAKRFKEKHKNAFTEKNRLYANVKRKFREPSAMIKGIIREEYIKGLVKRIKPKL